jgi:4-amino-4-deoxy-L-arabinose transferase-like glycosyltransferase
MSVFKKYQDLIIIFILIACNFILRGFYLSSNSLAGDEPFSVFYAQMDVGSIINFLNTGNNPPLYELILHYWIKFFGISEFSVRFPSLVFSSLSVFVIYKLSSKYFNNHVAIYSSVIFVLNDYHTAFSHESRVYALLGLLSLTSIYLFMGLLEYCTLDKIEHVKNNNSIRINFFLLIIVNTLIIYSHYFGFFILIAEFIFILLNSRIVSKYWKQLILGFLLIFILFLPIVFDFLSRFNDSTVNGTWVQPVESLGQLFDLILVWSNYNKYLYLVTLIVVIVSLWKYIYTANSNKLLKLFLLYIILPTFFITGFSIYFNIPFVWHLTSNKIYVLSLPIILLALNLIWVATQFHKGLNKTIYSNFISFVFVFILFFMFIISFRVPMFVDRYLMCSAIFFPIILALATDYIFNLEKYKYLAPLIVFVFYLQSYRPDLKNSSNVKEIVAKVKSLKGPNSVVYICPYWQDVNFTYYYNINYFKYDNISDIKSVMNTKLNSDNVFFIGNKNELNIDLIKSMNKIIYLDAGSDGSLPNNGVKDYLISHYPLDNKFNYSNNFVLYVFNSNNKAVNK